MATLLSTPLKTGKLAASDIVSDPDLSRTEVLALLDLAVKIKRYPVRFLGGLRGRSIALLFEKPSLRTRVTFELAIQQLGGSVVSIDGPIGAREPLKDVARNLDRWAGAIVARTFAQETVEELAQWSSVPVVNALSDRFHPCQALADALTIRERFHSFRGRKVAFIGDGNNVANSLMLTSRKLGMQFAIACPEGYEPKPEIVSQAAGAVRITHDPEQAVEGSHVVYTDVWASMGQEDEARRRREIFQPFQVNERLMARARPDAIFMHCLPARRGEETTDAVMESAQSVVFEQAGNRLHAQKALLLMLLC